MKLVQIVPQLAPSICGVGDYALRLAQCLRDRHQINTSFLVGDPNWYPEITSTDGFSIQRPQSRTADALRHTLKRSQPDALMLHYSGYGYHNRGVPFWLLGRYLQEVPSVTMFHELFATSTPMSSAFWLSPFMRLIVRSLVRRSTVLVTNREASARWIRRPTAILPVFSNLGEPGPEAMFKAKENLMAVFGHQSHIHPAYSTGLLQTIRKLNPSQVVLLGKPSPEMRLTLQDTPTIEVGVASASEVSHWLTRCKFGYFCYYPDSFGKSGILAAYAAHRLCVIYCGRSKTLSDGAEIDTHLMHYEAIQLTGHEQFAHNLHTWYQTHTLPATTDRYASILNQITPAARS